MPHPAVLETDRHGAYGGQVQRTGLHPAARARGRGAAMRRFTMVGAVLTAGTMLGVLAPAAGGTAAWAEGPQHVTSTFSDHFTAQPGELCDFTYHNEFMATVDALIFADGSEIDHIVINAIHTNMDTGF